MNPSANNSAILACVSEIEELTKLLQGRPNLVKNIKVQTHKIRSLVHESEPAKKKRNA